MLRLIIGIMLVSGGTLSSLAYGEVACQGLSRSRLFEESTAEAGVWKNFTNSQGSLSYESERLLNKALSLRASGLQPEVACPQKCIIAKAPLVVFTSLPKEFLKSYPDFQLCQQLFQESQEKPIRYDGRKFKDFEDFQDWLSDFSQGKGEDGKDLYRRCSGTCSPQYKHYISYQEGAGLSVDTSVVCGHERDKKDNKYFLSVKYLWSCG